MTKGGRGSLTFSKTLHFLVIYFSTPFSSLDFIFLFFLCHASFSHGKNDKMETWFMNEQNLSACVHDCLYVSDVLCDIIKAISTT